MYLPGDLVSPLRSTTQTTSSTVADSLGRWAPHLSPFFLSLGLAIRKKVSMFLSQSEVYLGFTNVKNKSTDNPRTYIFGIALFVNLASKPQTNAVETERGQMRGVR